MEPIVENQIVDAGEIIETKRGKKTKYILISIAASLFILGIILGLVLSSKNTPAEPILPLAPTLPPTSPTIKVPSPFATSSALLSIENELKTAKTEAENTELFEPSLTVPSFDLEIKLVD